jgi:glycosyltransferase involved in cell wall biosynthesis
MMPKIPCTVEILTRNSAKTLNRCLESVKDFAEIIVLDGNSTDGTLEIAARFDCRVVRQYDTYEPNIVIKNYSEVRNKGLRIASYDWFMFIDSDEYLSEEVVEEIRSIVTDPNPKEYVWWQPRKYVLGGKVIDCATTYPNRQIRLFHRGRVKEFIRPIHEKIEIKSGAPTGILRNYEYVPLGTKAELSTRWRRYTYIEAAGQRTASPMRLLRPAFRQKMLRLFYSARFLRNILFCRGRRLSWSYEWTRHKYLLILSWLLLKQALKNLRRAWKNS